MTWGLTLDGLTAVQQRWTYASQRLGQAVGQVVTKRLDEAVTYARATYLTGGTTATRLASRSGRLTQSFGAEVQVGAGQGGTLVSARIGYIHDAPGWVGIHEYGGTIRARNTRYLAIPLTEEARRTAPRQLGNSFVARSRRGNLLIFRKLEGGGIEPMYLLRESVVIPARPALRPTMERFTPLLVNDLKGVVRMLFTGGRA